MNLEKKGLFFISVKKGGSFGLTSQCFTSKKGVHFRLKSQCFIAKKGLFWAEKSVFCHKRGGHFQTGEQGWVPFFPGSEGCGRRPYHWFEWKAKINHICYKNKNCFGYKVCMFVSSHLAAGNWIDCMRMFGRNIVCVGLNNSDESMIADNHVISSCCTGFLYDVAGRLCVWQALYLAFNATTTWPAICRQYTGSNMVACRRCWVQQAPCWSAGWATYCARGSSADHFMSMFYNHSRGCP